MLGLKKAGGLASFTEQKRKTMLVSCFIVVKLLAAKVLFKPFKITSYFGKTIDFIKSKQAFKESCVSMGYTLIGLLTDFLFELFEEVFKSKGVDLRETRVVRQVKAKIY